MKKAVIGILAHVDSGKTTLCEAVLYKSGVIRKPGRVDHKDAFLDTNNIERDRGITIFSKQAVFDWKDTAFTLLDTPGHVDFSGETERTLSVIDGAILVISSLNGVQSHTRTLAKLLERYDVPTFVFVNKMDMQGADKDFVMRSLTAALGEGCISFAQPVQERDEALSLCSEELMDSYLENGELSREDIKAAVLRRQVIPVCFGSALRLEGIEELLDTVESYITEPQPREDLSAVVYKITQDQSGARLTHMKITGGTLRVRDTVEYKSRSGEQLSEKVSRIRIYNSEKFTSPEAVSQGQVCAVMGLSAAYAGQCLGAAAGEYEPILEPVLNYRVMAPQGFDDHTVLKYLRVLAEEDPTLSVSYDTQLSQISLDLMGEIQAEVVRRIMAERFGCEIEFGEGRIAYRETIAEAVDGAGHFEPLRHYAEVHLRLEPLPRGSGLRFSTSCSEDVLAKNWQRLILTHLKEKTHKGVLTGSPITDMRITLTAGRAHIKHTEGGDFRQATYRAVRQGLRSAKSVLLEPYYSFLLEVPTENTGRALNDIELMGGSVNAPETNGEMTVISGSAPVAKLRSYHTDVAGYTKGRGRLSCEFSGYDVCKNSDEVIAMTAYDPDADTDEPADSVFCSHGAGHIVPWYEAAKAMHVSPETGKRQFAQAQELRQQANDFVRRAADDDELMEIFERTYGSIERRKRYKMRTPKEVSPSKHKAAPVKKGPEYLLVDGYNIIFAWEELKKSAEKSLDLARSQLIDRMCSYQGFRQCRLILVFDAYRIKEPERTVSYQNIDVVYTKEAETADTYIERTAHTLSKENRVRVATSDGLEQVIIMGSGALRVSAKEFHEEVMAAERAIREYITELNSKRGGERLILPQK